MYTELSFLFDSADSISNRFNFQESLTSKDGDLPKSTQTTYADVEYDDESDGFVLNKYVIKKEDNDNFIKSNINAPYQTTGRNPYIQLLEDFEGNGEALKLKPSDFSYLRDIGVYPLNRLMILRRFPEGVTVPNDLNDLQNVKPVSVIIGWVKEDNDLLSYSFNEKWIKHTERLDELLGRIIQEQFGIDVKKILPVPGWGEGMMFGLYNSLGLTNYSSTSIPVGDPNLLKESITRDIDSQGLESKISFKLETVYEQKYIGGIDQTVAFMDILSNLHTMGTSNMKFLGKAGGKVINMLSAANNNPANPGGWANLIVYLVSHVIGVLSETLLNRKKTTEGIAEKQAQKEKEKPKDANQGQNENSGNSDNNNSAINNLTGKFDAAIGLIDNVKSLISTVLASTVARYQWPIRGAIAQLTGQPSTPWHLTIGNPYAPLLSMNNINVTGVNVKMGSEMSVNDLPKFINVEVEMEQGRNLGRQELTKLFGIEYQRKYKKI